MALGPDPTYSGQSRRYTKQQPAGTTLNGNAIVTEEVNDVGSLSNQYGLQAFNGQMMPGLISYTVGPTGGAGTHTCQVTVQVTDNGGQNIAGIPFDLDIILSDNANGVGVTAQTISSFTITAGTLLNTYSANKAVYAQTDATGKVTFTFICAATPQLYVMVQAGQQPLPSVGSVPAGTSYS